MLELPDPVEGGTLGDLRRFVNVERTEDFILVVSWLVGAFQPGGPYPLLALHGEQGSAKTTTANILRSLIDPSRR